MSKGFSTRFRVRFGDGDPGKISYFANVYGYAHSAFEDFVREGLGFQFDEWFDHPEWGLPFRKSECEYLKPLFPGKEYAVFIKIKEIRHTSFTSEFDFLDENGEACCVVRLVHTFVDRKAFKKHAIPSYVRERLTKFQCFGK